MLKNIIIYTFLTILFCSFSLESKTYFSRDTVNTILKQNSPQTPLEIIKESSEKNQKQTELPKSEFNYLPEQDSAFFRALRMQLPVNVLVRNNLIFSDNVWNIEKHINSGTPWQIALDNIKNIPPEFYNPSGVEMVHRQVAIENSFEVPFITTYQRYGLKVSAEAIASLLGLTEDVSPKISYSIDYTVNIEVVIYSVSASVVSTLFSGIQAPGYYTITWNGRNSAGKIMPAGDYIAEVRIGDEKYIRKRIVIR